MTKSAEQFDAEADAIVKRLINDIREPMTQFYNSVDTIATEMKDAAIGPHLMLAIMQKMERGLENSVDTLHTEIAGE